jgi:hypothetical protein
VTPTIYALMLANSIAMDNNLVFMSGGGISGWQAPAGSECSIAVLLSFGVHGAGQMPLILRITGNNDDLFGELMLPLEVQGADEDAMPSVANVAFNVSVQMPEVRTTTWFRIFTETGEQLGAVPMTLQPGVLLTSDLSG